MHLRILLPFAAAGLLACGAQPADVGNGKAVFAQQCVMCHAATTNEKKLGPSLKGLFKKDKLANGKKATEQNIRAQIDSGGGGMPPYKDMLSSRERDDLIGYLKTL
jgi:cytochrome c